ncbi:type II toxin-antitoxin system RelE/ParE family toxin [Pelagibius sp. Alg239-R121]|uniref:type II toxin-antitoxin system RelE/ParE family toxin n=1 Tax=Pelagibius sp. Alg239-R121 TaxID=2993448 RepID=UPI0024A647BB|nr:type II toxin-antitoxin system RelE/ParE family toxin [Pelagibius sp. Alg239-R121]
MAEIRWLPEALDGLKRLHAFIDPHSPQAAVRAIKTLVAAAESLAALPDLGRPWDLDTDFRELPVRFGARGYVIRYRNFEDQVFVVRVWHALEDR